MRKKLLVNGFLRVRLVSTTNKIDRCDIIEKNMVQVTLRVTNKLKSSNQSQIVDHNHKIMYFTIISSNNQYLNGGYYPFIDIK